MNFIFQVIVVGLAIAVVKSSAQFDTSPRLKLFGVKKLAQNRQFGPAATLTVTEYRTVVVTAFANTTEVCGKLVNVTGACRRRRGMWQDEPIIMTFDEGMDFVDQMLSPTPTLQFESTPVAQLIPTDALRELNQQPSTDVLQPSKSGIEDLDSRLPDDPAEGRFGFGFISRFFFDTILRPSSTITVTVTFVETDTITKTQYQLYTFFVQKCTPSPFPFSVCGVTR